MAFATHWLPPSAALYPCSRIDSHGPPSKCTCGSCAAASTSAPSSAGLPRENVQAVRGFCGCATGYRGCGELLMKHKQCIATINRFKKSMQLFFCNEMFNC